MDELLGREEGEDMIDTAGSGWVAHFVTLDIRKRDSWELLGLEQGI